MPDTLDEVIAWVNDPAKIGKARAAISYALGEATAIYIRQPGGDPMDIVNVQNLYSALCEGKVTVVRKGNGKEES